MLEIASDKFYIALERGFRSEYIPITLEDLDDIEKGIVKLRNKYTKLIKEE